MEVGYFYFFVKVTFDRRNPHHFDILTWKLAIFDLNKHILHISNTENRNIFVNLILIVHTKRSAFSVYLKFSVVYLLNKIEYGHCAENRVKEI